MSLSLPFVLVVAVALAAVAAIMAASAVESVVAVFAASCAAVDLLLPLLPPVAAASAVRQRLHCLQKSMQTISSPTEGGSNWNAGFGYCDTWLCQIWILLFLL